MSMEVNIVLEEYLWEPSSGRWNKIQIQRNGHRDKMPKIFLQLIITANVIQLELWFNQGTEEKGTDQCLRYPYFV